jgi:mannan endo-1,4-beta-mannosidase
VIEEFGFPRQGNGCDLNLPTTSRDSLYLTVFSRILKSAKDQGPLAGCNFWGWAGSGRPASEVWQKGNDFLCDPPHEPQGWYSVFDSDTTTIQIIKSATEEIMND